MYIHLFFSSDGQLFYIVQSTSNKKQDALNLLVKQQKRKHGSSSTEMQFGSPPEWDDDKHKVKKIGEKSKVLY
jgi:hypothetical protein